MAKKNALVWAVSADTKVAGRQVKSVLSMIGKMENCLHVAACSALVQCLVYRQSTPLVWLLEGLSGKSVHVVGLKKWAEAHGNGLTIGLEKQDDGTSKIAVKFPEIETHPVKDVKTALAWAAKVKPFWVEKPAPSMFEEYSLSKALAVALKRAEEMERAKNQGTIKRGKKGSEKIIELSEEQIKNIDTTGLAKLRELVAGLGADVVGAGPSKDTYLN